MKHNDTEDARARVLDSDELIAYVQRRAQEAVDSRDDSEEHQRHVSIRWPFHMLACFLHAMLSHGDKLLWTVKQHLLHE